MSIDATGREPAPQRADIWKLPEIRDVRAVLLRFEQPLVRYRGRERVEYREAVELMVRTDGPIPERALSPVLMVGDIAVDDYEFAGQDLYRFLGFDVAALKEGAPMRLEWPDLEPPPKRKPPGFELRGEERR